MWAADSCSCEEAVARARELGGCAEGWSDHERREWLAAFWEELARYLAKWLDIKMRRGPGENVTFEKAVSRLFRASKRIVAD